MGRDRYARQSLGALHTQIKQARVLLIGAGGIGCELLKNLVMTGFGHVDIIDLDTIDLSNLNRQFLFRHEHIKKPKAIVAKEAASKFNPSCSLTAHYANIKDTILFPISYFRSFDLVFNALDNLDARRHVNKMCLAADVPLIESGTTGFNGQVQVIKKSRTACYDCTEKEIPKSYPVCTIRSTPSQPIHCIVWAKSYLLPELFGRSEDEESEQVDTTEDSENAQELKNLKAEAQALKRIREDMNDDDFTQRVFDKVFKDDIDRLRGMEDMWKSRSPPISLNYSVLGPEITSNPTSPSDQNPWTLEENVSVFVSSLHRLRTRFQESLKSTPSTSEKPSITFDKDDLDTLDLVTSASNIRSFIFSIDLQSRFTVKQMAGNIIPAIATTNAMTAGLCVMQSFKVLRGDLKRAKMLFLETSGARVINSEPPRDPAPECAVCSVATAEIEADFSCAKLGDLVDGILRKAGGYGEEMTVMNDLGPIYDPDMEDMLDKKLDETGVKNGGFLTVIDDEDDPRVNLVLAISNKPITSNPPIRLSQPPSKSENGVSNGTADTPAQPRPAELIVPRKPKKPSPESTSVVNGSAASKPKRTAEQAGLDSIDDLKRRVSVHSLSNEAQKQMQLQIQKEMEVRSHEINGATVILDNDEEVGGSGVLNGNGVLGAAGAGGKDGSIVIDDD